MRKRSTEHLAKFEAAFQKYLDAYMTLRDFPSVKEMFGEVLSYLPLDILKLQEVRLTLTPGTTIGS